VRPLVTRVAVVALAAALRGAAAGPDVASPPPEAVLGAAFANRYDVDTIYDLVLVIRDRHGHEQRRGMHTVSKRIDGRTHSIGRLTEPESLRGMTVMIVETASGGRDVFVYLPALARVRRVSGSQRGDAFLGSDLTYEDFEAQHTRDFTLEALPAEQVAGERCAMIRGTPRQPRGYGAAVFAVAESDAAILEYRYFEPGADAPYRVIETPRSAMVRRGGHLLPTLFSVRNLVRGSSTELVIHELTADPPIDERIFSVRTLEEQGALP
jgi:hypothetical protein